MKTTILFLLLSAFCMAQTDAAYQSFRQDLETYMVTSDTVKKPAPCAQYELQYIVKTEKFEEKAFPASARTLCSDLKKYEARKTGTSGADWTYDIKVIGNRYYVVRADRNVGDKVEQEFYYYKRK